MKIKNAEKILYVHAEGRDSPLHFGVADDPSECKSGKVVYYEICVDLVEAIRRHMYLTHQNREDNAAMIAMIDRINPQWNDLNDALERLNAD